MISPLKWNKLGQVFDPSSLSEEVREKRPWLNEFAQAPATLIFEDFVRIFFSTRPKPDINGQYVSFSAFLDVARDNLFTILRISESPFLPLGDTGTFDEFGTYPVSVLRVPGSPKEVLAYFGGWTRCESVPFNVAIGIAKSDDGGESFERLGPGPILSYSPNEPFILSGPKIRYFNDKYYLFYIAGRKWVIADSRPEPVYKIRMAESADGIHWVKADRDLIPFRIEEDEPQASPDVFYKNGKYHMFFCYRYSTGYRGKERGYRIGYAHSGDLQNWTRNDDFAGLDVSDQGWDSEMVSYPHVFELDGSINMLYLGNQVGKNGFGLARLEGELE